LGVTIQGTSLIFLI